MKKLLIVLFLALLCLTALGATTIKVLAWDDAHTQAWVAKLEDFEKATGIKVELELIPSGSMLQKTSLNVTENKANYDLVAIDEGNVAKFGDLLVPYSKWPEGVTFKKVSTTEIPQAIFEAALWKGEIQGIPINGNVYVWITRKDLVENPQYKKEFMEKFGYELKVPETLDQLANMAEFFGTKGIYGWAPFTKNTEGATCEAIMFFEAFGTHFMQDVDGKYVITLDKEKALEAILFYRRLMQYAPPGANDMGHAERIAAFSDGKVFSMFQWPGIIPSHENEDESMVVGKIVYTAPPAGPYARAAVRGCWILGIPKASTNDAAAAEFAYWLNSFDAGMKLAEYGMTPVRTDLLTNPVLLETKPWYEGMAESGLFAVSRPNRSVYYPEISEQIKVNWLAAVLGTADPVTAIDNMVDQVQALLDKYGD